MGFLLVVDPPATSRALSSREQVLGLFFWLVFLADVVKAFDEL